MAYSPFDVSALPELGGLDSINLEEELKMISEKITGLEDVELDRIKGDAVEVEDKAGQEAERRGRGDATLDTLQNDPNLELSLDSIIASAAGPSTELSLESKQDHTKPDREHATIEHVTIEHRPDGSTSVVIDNAPAARGKKRVRISDAATVFSDEAAVTTTPTKSGDDEVEIDILMDGEGLGEGTTTNRAGKRRRIGDQQTHHHETSTEPVATGTEVEEPAGGGEQTRRTWGEVAAPATAGAGEGVDQGTTTITITTTDELELSWSWGDGETSETETDISHHQDSSFTHEADLKRQALLAEISVVEDVELNEEEDKLAKMLTANLNPDNPFEKPVLIRQRRVAKLRKRVEAHRNKLKQVLAKWETTSLRASITH